MPALITFWVQSFVHLFGIILLVENIFSIYGLGQLLLESILSRDYPVIEITSLFIACLTFIAYYLLDVFLYLIDNRFALVKEENYEEKNKNKFFFMLSFFLVLALISLHYFKNPNYIDKAKSLLAPNSHYLFGTDYLGRDLFSRIIIGTLQSLSLGFISLFLVILISIFLGVLAGYFKGKLDSVITFFTDIISCIPSMILALVFVGLFSNSIGTVLLSLILSWSGKYIRYIRNLVIDIKIKYFIVLAPMRGLSPLKVLTYHILPNIGLRLISLFLTDIGKIILSISGLSFIGIGIQPPSPELGTILYDGRSYFFDAPWIFIFPGIVLSIVVLSTNFLGKKVAEIWRL
ncbi:ABC transporter, permease protein [Streptococcus ictaluri 707-05]|uniref:ABC transporter, permease protein n=1 Tax=Streptococcus ictaluri 707-05 TaxID=764299 RepID=G5K357_9STRE|nr:ABC transporter, permease protein [Streptococcus ictaluri 707-05]